MEREERVQKIKELRTELRDIYEKKEALLQELGYFGLNYNRIYIELGANLFFKVEDGKIYERYEYEEECDDYYDDGYTTITKELYIETQYNRLTGEKYVLKDSFQAVVNNHSLLIEWDAKISMLENKIYDLKHDIKPLECCDMFVSCPPITELPRWGDGNPITEEELS